MHVTKFSDYALRVLIYLACKESDNLITISELAKTYSISVHHVRMVVYKLGQLGYVNCIQGKGGGLELALEPEEISVGEVIRKTEPDFCIVECFSPENKCSIVKACKLQHILSDALNAFFETLDQYTLADISDNKRSIMKQLTLRKKIVA